MSKAAKVADTQPKKYEVLVVGLGAVGAITALILQQSGIARITVVARSNYDVVKERGIDIKSTKHGEFLGWRPHRLCRSVSEAADTAYAFVVVLTKCLPDVHPTSTLLAPLIAPSYTEKHPNTDLPVFVLVQNGLGIEVDLYKALEDEKEKGNGLGGTGRIISVAIHILANQTGLSGVQHGTYDNFVLGIYRPGLTAFSIDSNTSAESSTLGQFEEIVRLGGGGVEVVPEVQRRKYVKNMANVVLAAIFVLTRYDMPAIFRPPPRQGESYEPYYYPGTQPLMEEFTVPIITGMGGELVQLAHALGFPDSEDGVPSDSGEKLVKLARETYSPASSFHKASTLADLERGAPMEIEVIWGSVVRLAKEKGISIPRVEMAYGIMLVVQNQILRERSARS